LARSSVFLPDAFYKAQRRRSGQEASVAPNNHIGKGTTFACRIRPHGEGRDFSRAEFAPDDVGFSR
jgi:hypothetical protein